MKHKKIRISRRLIKRAKQSAYEQVIRENKALKDRCRRLEESNKLLHIALDSAQYRANEAETKLRRE